MPNHKHMEFCTELLLWRTYIAGNSKIYSSLCVKNTRHLCMIITKYWASRNIFIMLSNIILQKKIRPVGSALRYANRRRDGRT